MPRKKNGKKAPAKSTKKETSPAIPKLAGSSKKVITESPRKRKHDAEENDLNKNTPNKTSPAKSAPAGSSDKIPMSEQSDSDTSEKEVAPHKKSSPAKRMPGKEGAKKVQEPKRKSEVKPKPKKIGAAGSPKLKHGEMWKHLDKLVENIQSHDLVRLNVIILKSIQDFIASKQ